MQILLMVVGLVLFVCLIIAHEFGHFILARRNGVEVKEFGIFFPPAIYKRKTKAGWTFSLNSIPLGGFVQLKGEHDSDKVKGGYGAASMWVKSKILAAGVLMNLLTAFVLFMILALIGIPKEIPNQYTVKSDTKVVSQKVFAGAIQSGSPAQKAGLKPNDVFISIGTPGHKPVIVNSINELPNITKSFAGKTINIRYVANGKTYTTTTSLLSPKVVTSSQNVYNRKVAATKLDCASIPYPKGYLGVSPTQYTLQRSTWSAPITAAGLTVQVTALTFQGLGHALGGLGSLIAGTVTGNSVVRANGQCNATSQLSGPIGVFFILKYGSSLGLRFVLFIIALVSLSLALFNILPIPALDGGKLWISLFARAIKKPLTKKREELINTIGAILLIVLIILICIVDVNRFF